MADPDPSTQQRRCLTSLLGVVCVLALGGALGACGTEEQDRHEVAALDRARLAQITRLSPAQYEAIKGIHVAGDEVDRLDNEGLDPEIILQPIFDACEDRAQGDPLLEPLLASCVAAFRSVVALAEALPCAGTEGCSDLYGEARERLQASARASRTNERAVSATRLPRNCRRVLVEDESDRRRVRRYDAALATLQAATRTPSTADDAIAARRLISMFNNDPSGGTSARELRRLRRHCRPRS